MIKIALPILLVLTVAVAGVFAFAPIQDATTVHSTLFATNLVRVTQTMDESTGLSGWMKFDRTVGQGAWEIEKLFLCDLESDGVGLGYFFEFQTETSQTTGTHAKMRNQMGHHQQTIYSGSGGANSFHQDGVCHNILMKMTFDEGYETGNTGTNSAAYLQLAGDEDNDVIVFIREFSGGMTSTPDGATMVAYITGLQSPTDMNIICDNGEKC